MKVKLIISFLIWAILIGSYINKKRNEPEPPCTITINPTGELILTGKEQMERMEYLLSGKSDIYECETDFKETETGTNVKDTSVFGNGANVIYCKAGKDETGYVVKKITLKTGYSDINNKWLNDTCHIYYIKPKIRIKHNLINPIAAGYNEMNFKTPVCRVEIVNTKGEIIRKIEYEGKDFFEKDPENRGKLYYSGNYRERKGFMEYPDSIITINGIELNPNGMINTLNSRLDYRIYWYGYTDMWIDHVSVENDVSAGLLTGKYDSWLSAMESINMEDVKNKITPGSQGVCLDYLISKINITKTGSKQP